MSQQFQSIEHEVIFNKLKESLKDTEVIDVNQVPSAERHHQYLSELHRFINTMLKTRENHAYRYLFSHRKITGPLIVFGKKVVRKLLKWYLEPVTIQQTEFNNAVTPAIGRLTELASELLSKTGMVEQFVQTTQELQQKQIKLDNEFSKYVQEQEHNQIVAELPQFVRKQEYHEALSEIKQELHERFIEKINDMNRQFEDRIALIEKKQSLQEEYNNQNTLFVNKIEEMDIFSGDSESSSFFEKNTFAQSGEDSIIAYIIHVLGIPFEEVSYIDLGANHAKELSNTYFFYKKGAKGVLVEANSVLIPELKFYRHRDIIVNKCVDVVDDNKIEFYILNGDGLSTPDYEAAVKFCEINPSLKIIDKKVIETISYNTIVKQYLGKSPTILSIDIEGKDMEVLKSIDFVNYRPLIVVTEMIKYDINLNYNTKNAAIKEFLNSMGYDEYAFTGINSIFLDKRYMNERNKENEYSN
ncbi:FkbM family methyltransferase [Paenibacillus sp. GYB003]|uniref:FkbM family methyltransferase n=1 Tax=Paenibacillus sp. GYB003 TaxID=2994392 RepID=UPI002F962F95